QSRPPSACRCGTRSAWSAGSMAPYASGRTIGPRPPACWPIGEGSMTETADIVIVGGGIVGTSIAYHLAQRGSGRGVVLLERDTLGSGSTGRSAGGIRSQYSTEINIRFSLESVEFWRHFEEIVGLPVDYHENGYVFLAQTADERA